MEKIDLQIHSTASDGNFSPTEVIDIAIKNEMKAIAITDHDTVSGIQEAIDYSKDKQIEFIPGIEISCKESEFKPTIDILGLFIDHNNQELINFLDKIKKDRVEEKKIIIKKLNNLGYEITLEELLKKADDSLGRPHIARILIEKYPEKFSTVDQVFNELIGEGKPAFHPRDKITMEKAINVINSAGGISILAHPGRYLNEYPDIIKKLISLNGDGIEVDYPYSKILKISEEKSDEINNHLRETASKENLLMSGGSDFHDFERGSEIGDAGLSEEEFQKLKSALN